MLETCLESQLIAKLTTCPIWFLEGKLAGLVFTCYSGQTYRHTKTPLHVIFMAGNVKIKWTHKHMMGWLMVFVR